ncbi:hypothetical protein GBF38_000123 [Nibea albiflora]|nr:hypothetical protein GBF38_000123 [Nibea albiflora]
MSGWREERERLKTVRRRKISDRWREHGGDRTLALRLPGDTQPGQRRRRRQTGTATAGGRDAGDRKEAAENKRPAVDASFYNAETAPHNCGPSEQTHSKSPPDPSPAPARLDNGLQLPLLPRPQPRHQSHAPAPAATATSAQAPSLTPAIPGSGRVPTASAPAPTASSFPPSPKLPHPRGHCGSQEDEPLSLTAQAAGKQQQQQQEYVTPSWSLSPSSSPISHSDASDSVRWRRGQRQPPWARATAVARNVAGTPSKKKTPPSDPTWAATTGFPASIPPHSRQLPSSHHPAQSSPPCTSSSSLFK